ncbi:M20 family metallopeptidase [Castellaniella sp.]|uniref:M20 family metallopeptidase n=1 Tax=Castellaniella sp. TaxID=1955812 RepID=UPI00355EF962
MTSITTETGSALLDHFNARLPDMRALLERLVNIDSGSHDKQGVDAVSSILAERLAGLGFAIERKPNAAVGDFVVARKSLGGAGRVLILGHADTVWPAGTVAHWPYQERDDDLATGPGVGDMKSGLVIALFALEHLLENGFDALESITYAIVPDEEIGSVNSRAHIEALARDADYALVLEPGRPGNGITTARGALGNLFMHAHGCTAHCAVNFKSGASAVRALAMKVADLEALSEPEDGTVVNVGVFEGGVAKQVVPAEAMLNIDVRARTQERAQALLDRITAIAQRQDVERVQVEIRGGMTRPAFTPDNNRTLYALARDISGELGFDIHEVPPTAGGSDGNFPAAMGVPTLDSLGPVSHDICSLQETMEIQTMVTRGAMLHEIIRRISQLHSNTL